MLYHKSHFAVKKSLGMLSRSAFRTLSKIQDKAICENS